MVGGRGFEENIVNINQISLAVAVTFVMVKWNEPNEIMKIGVSCCRCLFVELKKKKDPVPYS